MKDDPVDSEEFWKERIKDAELRGMLHRSVYIVHPEGWKRLTAAHKNICENLIDPDAKVLDAGCGYGRMSPWFNHYVGVDFSPDFIKRAEDMYPNKKFIQANLKDLPFDDETFDWAICVSIKQMVQGRLGDEEWNKMEKELKRVAKKVLILEYVDYENYEIL